MNKVILVGRIGKDPETFTFKDGNKKTTFSLATTEKYKTKEGEWKDTTEWHNIVLYRETKLLKGDLIEIEGKITTRSWESSDGVKKYITEIVARTAGLLNRKQSVKGLTTDHREQTEPESPEDDLPF